MRVLLYVWKRFHACGSISRGQRILDRGCAMLQRKGFTLIELLVVIAIIAILAAILFPVFVTVKAKGQQSACMANMKQISSAVYSYLADFNDTFPPNRMRDPLISSGTKLNGTRYNWKTAIHGYIRNKEGVWRCASNINSDSYDETGTSPALPAAAQASSQKFPISYVYNGDFFNIFETPNDPMQKPRAMKVSDIPKPTKLIIICEGQEREPDIHPDQVVTLPTFKDYSTGRIIKSSRITLHQGNISNYIFCDTHARTLKLVPTFTPVSMWHPSRSLQHRYDEVADQIPEQYR